jgi:PncC family amidohydrolase
MVMKLEKLIGDLLRKNGVTISVAESITGGRICDRLTNIPGSSNYFMGGVVAYSNESKIKHLSVHKEKIKRYGAVSSQVAKEMAKGVKETFSTEYGLSTTGIAGPTGATPRKPIGLVFIGLAKGRNIWVKKLNLKGTRGQIKDKASEYALQFLYEKLSK